jgi:hypothetical protein
MSRVPWPKFLHRQPQAHLVVGVIVQAEGPVGGDELNAVRNLLNRLVRQQKPSGDYATTVARDTGRPEAWFTFVDESDARKFGDAVKAEVIGSYPGWASQRAFDVDSAKLRELEASLPLPQRDKRRAPPDGSSLRIRVRRGPRAHVTRYDEE